MRGLLAIDLGGTGARACWTPLSGGAASRSATGDGLRVDTDGVGIAPAVAQVVQRLGTTPDEIAAVGIGSSGFLTLTPDWAALAKALRAALGSAPIALTSDALTSALGALGGASGAVVLAGTGATAVGVTTGDAWVKADGWGHVLGDRGSGSWIGRQGLRVALDHHDGYRTGPSPLLAAATERFGDPAGWPRQIYPQPNRAGILGSFAPDVFALVGRDPDATEIVDRAAAHLAASASVVATPDVDPVVTVTGGLFRAGPVLTDRFEHHLGTIRPDVSLRAPRGTSLDGATQLARRVALGTLRADDEFVRVLP